MEAKKILTILVVALALMVFQDGVSEAEPMGTAFIYQGRLMDANGPADGLYDFEFKLYDAVEDGNQLDGTVDINDLTVYDGYFTVLLDFGSSVFNGDARWLEICVRPGDSEGRCTTLSPRQEVTAAPYALQTRGMFVDDVLNVGIGTTSPVGKLHVDGGKAMDGTVGANVVIKAQDGGDGWAMQNDGAAGGDIILLPGEGGEEYGGGSPGPAGNVGIGTTSPEAKLGIASPSSGAALGVGRASGEPSIVASSDAHGGWLIMDSTGSGKTGLNYYDDGDVILVNGGGNVGIGIASPAYPLHVKKNSANTWIAGLHNLGTGPQDYGLVVRADGGDPLLVQAGSLNALNVKQNGNIGIGTTSPATKLHIVGGSDASLTGNGYLMTGSENSKSIAIDDNEIIARDNGNAARLYLNLGSGNVVVEVLEITGGSDVAEPFEVADADSVEAGMVLAIDPENPGQLRIADKPYDRTVAGVVSGANGIKPGMTMTQKGTITEDSLLVAMTGRVYVLADASKERIEPGDLLTTSQIPGHAMKVTDYSRAQGAILGKAMSSLEQGQGLVLVLVALQ